MLRCKVVPTSAAHASGRANAPEQNILYLTYPADYRNIGVPGTLGGSSSQDAQQQAAAAALRQMARASGPSLAEVLKPEVILPLLQVTASTDGAHAMDVLQSALRCCPATV